MEPKIFNCVLVLVINHFISRDSEVLNFCVIELELSVKIYLVRVMAKQQIIIEQICLRLVFY